MTCEECGSNNLEVNGLCYVCKDCNNTDDSTWNMIMSRVKSTSKNKLDEVLEEQNDINKRN